MLKVFRWLLFYPIRIKYEKQFETKKGYVIEIQVQSKTANPVRIKKDRIRVRIGKDKSLLKKSKDNKIVYGEYVEIYDSTVVLNAKLNDLTVGNMSDCVWVSPEETTWWLLIQVAGPGSSNASARLQFGKIYVSIKMQIRKSIFWRNYVIFPINHVSIIAGNKNTKIIDKQ